MDAPRDPCKNKDGSTKASYYKGSTAKRAAKKIAKNYKGGHDKGQGRFTYYLCPKCGLYHLGHNRYSERRSA